MRFTEIAMNKREYYLNYVQALETPILTILLQLLIILLNTVINRLSSHRVQNKLIKENTTTLMKKLHSLFTCSTYVVREMRL